MNYLSVSAYFCRVSVCLAMLLGFLQINSLAQHQSGVWAGKTEDEVQSRSRRFIVPNKFSSMD